MIQAFGDESAGERLVAYAIVACPEAAAAEVGRSVEVLKAKHGFERLHCRQLFALDQRRKLGITHLTTDLVIDALDEIAKLISQSPVDIIVGTARKAEFQKSIPAEGPWPAQHFDDKNLGAMCARNALIPLIRDLGQRNLQFWPDPDPTVVRYFGKRSPVSATMGSFYDLPGSDGKFLASPLSELQNDERRTLFEVADLAAWLVVRTARREGSGLERKLRAVMRQLPGMIVRTTFGPTGGLMCNVPDHQLRNAPVRFDKATLKHGGATPDGRG